MHIGNQGVKSTGAIIFVERPFICPIDGSIEKLRVPSAVPEKATTATALTFFHQTVDESFVLAAETLRRQLLSHKPFQPINNAPKVSQVADLSILDRSQCDHVSSEN